jgi:hypothetical protein
MGGCVSRMKKEMQAPPVQPGNWEGLEPQRPEPYVPRSNRREMKTDGGPIQRKETPSGMPGLTYDQAGRPV